MIELFLEWQHLNSSTNLREREEQRCFRLPPGVSVPQAEDHLSRLLAGRRMNQGSVSIKGSVVLLNIQTGYGTPLNLLPIVYRESFPMAKAAGA